MVSRALKVGLRTWELICTIVVMGLIGNMIATAFKGNPAMINYDMFAATFAMATLLYLLPTSFLEDYSNPVVTIILDALNVLFWFCAAVATAAYLHVHSCSNKRYTLTNHITNGSFNTEKRCREAQASTAFLWFGWVAFVVSLIFSVMSRGNVNLRGGIRKPAMSQVGSV